MNVANPPVWAQVSPSARSPLFLETPQHHPGTRGHLLSQDHGLVAGRAQDVRGKKIQWFWHLGVLELRVRPGEGVGKGTREGAERMRSPTWHCFRRNFQPLSSHGACKLNPAVLRRTRKHSSCQSDQKNRYNFDLFTPDDFCINCCPFLV